MAAPSPVTVLLTANDPLKLIEETNRLIAVQPVKPELRIL